MDKRLAGLLLAGLISVATAACADPEKDKQRYLDSGNQFFADKKYAEAIVEYRNAIGVDDRFGEARFKLAEAYELGGDRNAAFKEYIRAADLLPENATAQIKAATYLAMARQFEDAKTRIERLLQNDPNNVEAQILLGSILAGLRDLGGAVTQVEEAIQIDPARGSSYTNLGMLRLAQGERDRARAAFEKAVQVDPRSVQAQLALAMFHLQVGEVPAAEEAMKQALTIDPHHALTNRALAALYLASNRAPEAERHLKAVADTTQSPQARLALADYYVRSERVDDAKSTLAPLVRNDATFADATSRLAQIEYVVGDRSRAHGMLDEILVRHPQSPGVLLTKARWLLAEGKTSEALQRTETAVKAAPQSPATHYLLGLVQAAMQDKPAAIAAFNEVLRLNPRVAAAELQLSRLQLAQGATTEAVQLAESALKNAPGSPEARLTLARGLIAQRDHGRAEPIVAEILKAYPNVAAAHVLDGALHISKNELAKARASYDRALLLDPKSYGAFSGLTSIDMLENKTPAARARVEARLAATPDDVPLLLLAGRVFLGVNEPARAEQALRRAIDLAPAESLAYSLLGQLYIAQQRLDEAQTEFDNVARRNPKNIGARTLSAVIAHQKNSLEDAKKRYREILDVDPTATVAANNLAWIYADEGRDLDEALRLAQNADQHSPDNPQVQDTIGWIYYRKELPSLAIAAFERSVAKEPGNPTYHYHLGMAYAKSGNVASAQRALASALKLRPDYREARDLQATLK